MNLLYWQVTCEAFCTPKEWKWWFKETNYKGDYSFIYLSNEENFDNSSSFREK